MYADQITTGGKRSIRDRLNGDLPDDLGRSRGGSGKRQRQSDDKWKHDLYQEDEEPQASKSIGPRDLRLKLQRKGSQQVNSGGRARGVRDLREKLSGTMRTQPPNNDIAKTKPSSQVAKPLRYEPPIEARAVETKKVSKPTTSKKMSQQKSESSVDGFLRSLDLEKYLIIFQAEEVDMTALMHMTDEDLKALGVPMGPRKKILLALESKP